MLVGVAHHQENQEGGKMVSMLDELQNRFPRLFENFPGPMYFDIGPGWFGIVAELLEKLDAMNIPDLRVFQVKQKFGGLRCNLDGSWNDETSALIKQAEQESLHTCEQCGWEATCTDQETLCAACRAERYKRVP